VGDIDPLLLAVLLIVMIGDYIAFGEDVAEKLGLLVCEASD
jgi:hypothetical protein